MMSDEFLTKRHVFIHIPTEDAPEAVHIACIALQRMQWKKKEPAVHMYWDRLDVMQSSNRDFTWELNS